MFVVLAIMANSLIHSSFIKLSSGGGGMLTCMWLFNSFMIECVLEVVKFFVMYIAFLVKWYVLMCFFHIFWVFLSRYPPCSVILLVKIGIGGKLQAFSIFFDMFCTM